MTKVIIRQSSLKKTILLEMNVVHLFHQSVDYICPMDMKLISTTVSKLVSRPWIIIVNTAIVNGDHPGKSCYMIYLKQKRLVNYKQLARNRSIYSNSTVTAFTQQCALIRVCKINTLTQY